MAAAVIDALDRRLLSEFQHRLPLEPRPFYAMAERLGIGEDEVMARLASLQDNGIVSRVGAIFRPNAVGASTLAAMAVPEDRLEEVAALVSALPQVNHNYQREHRLNLWFVVAATDGAEVARVLDHIRGATGLDVLDLPMEEHFHIDLGFDIQWK